MRGGMGSQELIIGPADRIRPLAGPIAGSGRTRWLNLSYTPTPRHAPSKVAGSQIRVAGFG